LLLPVRKKLSQRPWVERAVPPGAKSPAFIRFQSSDYATFVKIFIDREYEVPLSKEPTAIIDAGANVGFASIFFAIKYPQARIIAIEPEPSNFAQLQRNVAPYPNIIPVQAALWFESATLDLLDPGSGSWAFQARKNSSDDKHRSIGSVQGLTISDVMKAHKLDAVDILKIDIESGEKEVFSANTAWTNNVGVIMIELHDRFRDGCSQSFYSATKDFDQKMQQGENVILLRSEYAAAAPAKD
jgi:FkbM family methyltransferase